MSTYTANIGASNRTVLVETFSAQETANGVDTISCEVFSSDASYRPAIDDTFYFYEGATKRFGGKVESVDERGAANNGTSAGILMGINAKSFSIFPQRRVRTLTLAAGSLSSQLTALIADCLDDFGVTLHGSQVTGPTLPELNFVEVRGDEILNAIVKAATSVGGTGYVWKIDADNKLRVTSTGEIAAPFNVVDGDGHAILDVAVSSTRNDLYANRLLVSVNSGPETSTETFVVADGVSSGGLTVFTAKYPASQSINDAWPNVLIVDGVIQGPIAPDTDWLVVNGGLFSWAWDWTTSPARLIYDESSPPAGPGMITGAEVITITYSIRYPITKTVEDAAGIALYGPWERTVDAPAGLSDAALTEFAEGILAAQSPVRQSVTYQTRQTGISPGMTQTINLTKRAINETVLVQEVSTQFPTPTEAIRTVSAVVSPVFQGTFRGTVEQWMRGGSGGGVSIGAGGGGAAVAAPFRSVQFNDEGAFGGSDYFKFKGTETFSGYPANVMVKAEDESRYNQVLVGPDDTFVSAQVYNGGSFYLIGAGGASGDWSFQPSRDFAIVSARKVTIDIGDDFADAIHLRGIVSSRGVVTGATRTTSTSVTVDGSGTAKETYYCVADAGAITLALPSLTAANVNPATGQYRRFCIRNDGTSKTVTIDPNSTDTIDGATTLVLHPGQSVTIQGLTGTGAGWKIVASHNMGVRSLTVTLTDAQIKALPTTPITLVAAHGSGYAIKPLALTFYSKTSSGAYTNINAAAVMNVRFDSTHQGLGYIPNDASITNGSATLLSDLLGTTTNTRASLTMQQTTEGANSRGPLPLVESTAGFDNAALVVDINNAGSGALTGGNAANTLTAKVYYVIEAVP